MKVSVITMHNFPNYGSVLQAYATQEKLREFSADVEIVDYSGGESTVGRSMAEYLRVGLGPNPAKAIARLPVRLWRRRLFDGFARQHLNMTERRYTTEEDFSGFPAHSGIYCTGSDQVWNPFFKENMRFFWDFIPADRRKFGFAVSFGNYAEERLSPGEVARIKQYVDQFDYISVREERGLRILREQLDYPGAIQLVDPTLAMPPGFWRDLAPGPGVNGDYILLYKLGRDEAFETYAKEVSRRTGLPLVRFCSQGIGQVMLKGARKIFLPPVFRFISLIDNARYVITDSFHGAAFAMNLNTELIVYREQYDGGRISDFLRIVGQGRRYVKDCGDFAVLSDPTDFGHVNRALANERERVDAFLRKVFGGAV